MRTWAIAALAATLRASLLAAEGGKDGFYPMEKLNRGIIAVNQQIGSDICPSC